MDLGERRNELNNQIELRGGFEELRKNLEEFEEMTKMAGIRFQPRHNRKQMRKVRGLLSQEGKR